MLVVIATMLASLMLTSLDQIFNDSSTSSRVRSVLGTACLDERLFGGELWRLLTHMWIHGSVGHFTSNVVSLIALWALARRCFARSEWFGIFMFSGVAAGLVQLCVEPAQGPDFSKWTGPAAAYFGQPDSPLVGASGGICGMWGALCAVTCRYLGSSSSSSHGFGPSRNIAVWLLLSFGVQVLVDSCSPGVAGAGHVAGFLVGFCIAVSHWLLPAYSLAAAEAPEGA